jgi:hypothetical protein
VPKWESAPAAVGATALFAGGWTGSAYTDVVDVFNTATGMWSTAKLSVPRAGRTAATVGHRVIVASGISAASKRVDVYDGLSGKWSTLSVPRRAAFYAAASADGAAAFVSMGVGAEIFNTRTHKWRVTSVPTGLSPVVGTSVADRAYFADSTGSLVYVYDAEAGRWSTIPIPSGTAAGSATSLGTKVIFAGARSDGSGVEAAIYDTVTDTWSTAALPANAGVDAATSVGSNALIAGSQSDVVSVYDATTGQWSTTTLAEARLAPSAVTAGTHAIFAGGSVGQSEAIVPSDTVDIFTDTAPSAVLAGNLRGKAGHKESVTVFNTGDADLAGGYSVEVYASADRTLAGAILLGSVTVQSTLAAGSSAQVGVPTTLLKSTPPGTYHLLAAVATNGNVTPIAAEGATFTVRARGALQPASDHGGTGVARGALMRIGRSGAGLI